MKSWLEIGLGLLSFLVVAGAVGEMDYYTEVGYRYSEVNLVLPIILAVVIGMITLVVHRWRCK